MLNWNFDVIVTKDPIYINATVLAGVLLTSSSEDKAPAAGEDNLSECSSPSVMFGREITWSSGSSSTLPIHRQAKKRLRVNSACTRDRTEY